MILLLAISLPQVLNEIQLEFRMSFSISNFFMGCNERCVDAHFFANPYPKAHEEKIPMKSKAQRPTKKTEEQERSKEISESESNLQQNTNLP